MRNLIAEVFLGNIPSRFADFLVVDHRHHINVKEKKLETMDRNCQILGSGTVKQGNDCWDFFLNGTD